MERSEKALWAQQLGELYEKSAGFFVLGYQGLKVEELSDLRRSLRAAGARLKVIKNHIANKSLQSFSLDASFLLKGQTLFVFVQDNLAASAKVLCDFAKDHALLALKGGVVSGQVFGEEGLKAYSRLPSRDEVFASLLRVLQGPSCQALRLLSAVPEALVRVLKNVSDAKAS